MVPPLTLCAYMKKGPNLRWSLIQCSGGDEGDRTPDLLTASQALSQLSYAPVRRSTIRELPRRCKDNFGKYFAGGGEGGAARPRTRARERASKSRDAPSRPRGAPRGRRPRRPPLRRPWDISSPADRRFSLPRRGPPSAQRPSRRRRAHYRGPTAPPPTRRSQNHAGLRGQAGNPQACRNR